jgi:hypothetical protein
LLDINEDGIQTALPLFFSTNLTDEKLSEVLFLLWYIWKARNDNRFHRKIWTPFQMLTKINSLSNKQTSLLPPLYIVEMNQTIQILPTLLISFVILMHRLSRIILILSPEGLDWE